MAFSPNFLTTVVGSFPHADAQALSEHLLRALDIPDWPQLPRRTFKESMYAQYSTALPGLVVDEGREKVFFDTGGDLTPALEIFYERYLADDVDAFGLTPEYAAGFFAMRSALRSQRSVPGGPGAEWVKGQVTGPISFGLTVTDQNLRASLYDDMLADPIVKNTAMNARWQVRQLKVLRPNVFVFVDEPYMASFGSAYISLSREQVTAMLDEVFDAIHAEGALAGVHCCANTDWSVLLGTQVDILNLDAYGYLENLALYPAELRTFLDRGGVVCWGIVPNNEQIYSVTPQGLAEQLLTGLAAIESKARARGVQITAQEFATRSLIAPSCGLAPTSVEIADHVLEVLAETGKILQSK